MPTATPKLVLLPGMDGTGELFDSFVKALPQSFTTEIVRYPPNRCLTSSELLHLVDSNAFGSEPFVLIAESFSSPLAIQWAATNPLNLKGLVICAGFTTSPIRGPLRSIFRLLSPFCFLVTPPCECNRAIARWARCATLAGGCCKVCDLIGKTGGALPSSPRDPDL